MNKVFPPAMIQAAKLGKISFLSDPPQPKNPNDCKNCGGWGFFVLFIATNGPFKSPAAHKVSKWHDGGWWVGESNTFKCPVCCNDNDGSPKKPPDNWPPTPPPNRPRSPDPSPNAQRPSRYSQPPMIEDRPSAITWGSLVDQYTGEVLEEIE